MNQDGPEDDLDVADDVNQAVLDDEDIEAKEQKDDDKE